MVGRGTGAQRSRGGEPRPPSILGGPCRGGSLVLPGSPGLSSSMSTGGPWLLEAFLWHRSGTLSIGLAAESLHCSSSWPTAFSHLVPPGSLQVTGLCRRGLGQKWHFHVLSSSCCQRDALTIPSGDLKCSGHLSSVGLLAGDRLGHVSP